MGFWNGAKKMGQEVKQMIGANSSLTGRGKRIFTEQGKNINNLKGGAKRDGLIKAFKEDSAIAEEIGKSGSNKDAFNMIRERTGDGAIKTTGNAIGDYYSGMKADGTRGVGTALARGGATAGGLGAAGMTVNAVSGRKRNNDIGGRPY